MDAGDTPSLPKRLLPGAVALGSFVLLAVFYLLAFRTVRFHDDYVKGAQQSRVAVFGLKLPCSLSARPWVREFFEPANQICIALHGSREFTGRINGYYSRFFHFETREGRKLDVYVDTEREEFLETLPRTPLTVTVRYRQTRGNALGSYIYELESFRPAGL